MWIGSAKIAANESIGDVGVLELQKFQTSTKDE